MSLEDNVKGDLKLFEGVRKEYGLLNEVIAGRINLAETADDYSQRFEDFTRMQTKNILKVMKIRQDIQQYESELSMLEQMLGKLDPGFSSFTYSVENYTQARKSLEKFNKGKKTMVAGVSSLVAAYLLTHIVPPLGILPLIVLGAYFGGGIATIRGGYVMASTNSEMSLDDLRTCMGNYFNVLSETAKKVDHRIGLAYAAERFSNNREAFGRDYNSFSDEEMGWCRGYLEKLLPLGVLNTSQAQFENYFWLIDRKKQP